MIRKLRTGHWKATGRPPEKSCGKSPTQIRILKAGVHGETCPAPVPHLEDPFFSWWAIYKSVIKFNISQLEENKEKLINILGRHVFSKKITSSEINGEIKIKAINGEEITIKKVNGIIYINEAEVVTADIETPNGVIHFINRVLQPLN